MEQYNIKIAQELAVGSKQVSATIALLDEGATVPFISRYRKEATGSLDEVQVAAIRDRVQQLRDLDKRREAILKSLTDMGKLTPELESRSTPPKPWCCWKIFTCLTAPNVKPVLLRAREKGLQPLADIHTRSKNIDPELEAGKL
jgi:uncharacterized protein